MKKNIFIIIISCFTLSMGAMKRPGSDLSSSTIKKPRSLLSPHFLLQTEDFEGLFKNISDKECNINEEDKEKRSFLENILNKINQERQEREDILARPESILDYLILPRIVIRLKEQTQRIQQLQEIAIKTTEHPSFKRDAMTSRGHILNFLAHHRADENLETFEKSLEELIHGLKNFVSDSLGQGDLSPHWINKYPEKMQTIDFQKKIVHTNFYTKNKEDISYIVDGFYKEDGLDDRINMNIIGTCDDKNPFNSAGKTPLHTLALRNSDNDGDLNNPQMEQKKYRNNQKALRLAALLLINGANPHCLSLSSKSTPLIYCCNNKDEAFPDKAMAHILISHGAKVEETNTREQSFKSQAGDTLTYALLASTKNQTRSHQITSLLNPYSRAHTNLHTSLTQRETGAKRFLPTNALTISDLETKRATDFALNYSDQTQD